MQGSGESGPKWFFSPKKVLHIVSAAAWLKRRCEYLRLLYCPVASGIKSQRNPFVRVFNGACLVLKWLSLVANWYYTGTWTEFMLFKSLSIRLYNVGQRGNGQEMRLEPFRFQDVMFPVSIAAVFFCLFLSFSGTVQTWRALVIEPSQGCYLFFVWDSRKWHIFLFTFSANAARET